jgi:hypothetical protein
LFVAYSRFEFALKECGYVTSKPGIAYADWVSFAREDCLRDVMYEAAKNADVTELIQNPPRMQITNGKGSWGWDQENGKPVFTLKDFFEAIKQVRDNLFHGGKSGEDHRDEKLCRAAWAVLTLCLERHLGVRAMFEGRY